MVVIRRIELYSGSWSLKYKIIDLVNPWGLQTIRRLTTMGAITREKLILINRQIGNGG
jgi:hypothetical protein